jgi:serine/threonine-protein kinase HipA
MTEASRIEIHLDGRWVEAASLQVFGPDRCRIDYLPQYQFSANPVPLSLGWPLDAPPDLVLHREGLPDEFDRRAPPFLYDLVPQGRGRQFLLKQLGLADSDNLVLPLLMAGAFNPIGCLRLQSAVNFYAQHTTVGEQDEGFSLQDILSKSEAFLDHLSLHAMLAAGTTGVQGVAPKFLLTQDADDRWYADLALPDDKARAHWLVKLPRGRSDEDRAVLRNEAAYLRIATVLGIRAHAAPMLHGDMLFVRRFDRLVDATGVRRLHQESVASLAGVRGFGMPLSMQEMLLAIRANVTRPQAETIEFLKRDALNIALRNTDNHARNTAVQRLPDGTVQLTPVFDFAPMFMDPEIVPRSSHWLTVDGKRRVTDFRQIAELLGTLLPEKEMRAVLTELKAFGVEVARLPEVARDQCVESAVLDQCLLSIERVARELQDLSV